MLTYSSVYEKRLRDLIAARIEDIKDRMATGLGTEDFATYKKQIGHIDGLKDALELMTEALEYVEKNERTI